MIPILKASLRLGATQPTGILALTSTYRANLYLGSETPLDHPAWVQVILSPQVGVEIRLSWVPGVSSVLDIPSVYYTDIIKAIWAGFWPFLRGLTPRLGGSKSQRSRLYLNTAFSCPAVLGHQYRCYFHGIQALSQLPHSFVLSGDLEMLG